MIAEERASYGPDVGKATTFALPDPFPVARYRVECIVERSLQLPDYAGSTLRGALGHAFKAIVCVTGLPQCRNCALFRTCAYPAVFETPPPGARRVYTEIPHPYVIEAPEVPSRRYRSGERIAFHFVLIGPALARLPLIALAWRRALAGGIGVGDGAARLDGIWVEGDAEPVLDGTLKTLRTHAIGIALRVPETVPSAAEIEFATPVRIKRGGRVLGAHELKAADILMALARRSADLAELLLGAAPGWDFAGVKRAAAAVASESDFTWRDWARYSNRQKQGMPLGGVVGRMQMRGDLRPFWKLLYLGQWLHAGGKTTFGLGRYVMRPAA